MACINFPSPVFGPIHSRRLGTSLGLNLLPEGGKLCSFDCIYCECGFNKDNRENTKLPSREKVKSVLEKKLIQLTEEGVTPDVFTFAGNGEPTSHPDFEEIVGDVIELRDKYFPKAKISVLSNSTFIAKPHVFRALKRVDNNILKLDTVNEEFIKMVDRPNSSYDLKKTIENLKRFNGELIIQTIFLKGRTQGKEIDNTTEEFIVPWISALKEIQPKEVMIYTLARETPAPDLEKIPKEKMDEIGQRLKNEGFRVSVSY
ncbi:radical SAM protein [Turicimonas sp. TL08]